MSLLVLLAAILAASVVFFTVIGLGAYFKKENNTEEPDFTQISSELEVEEKKELEINPKSWTGFWYYKAEKAGIRYDSPATPSNIASAIVVIAGAIGGFVIPANIMGAIALPLGGLVLYYFYYASASNKRVKQIELSLPNLLAGLRANLQSNMTPDRALQAMADETEGPLGEELQLFKNDVMLNVSLDDALDRLGERINSSELKFLISSIKLAIKSGVDLDPQIAIIQKIVKQRGRIKSALSIAIAQVQPVMIITIAIIPLGYLYSVSSSEDNSDFWLTTGAGFIATALVVVLYVAGIFVTRSQIAKVRAQGS